MSDPESFLAGRVRLFVGDSRDVLLALPDASIDSVVTDPPYALVSIGKSFGKPGAAAAKDYSGERAGATGAYARASSGFMGQAWDTGETAFAVEFWREVMRVLKPGGHVLAFGGTRSYHRLACAVEDAGFEIRDQIGWCYGSGFPKSRNIGDGWGTALKPAWEPIVLARKPLGGTVAENVLQHGTGAINIDGCRIETSDDLNGGAYSGDLRQREERTSTDTFPGSVPLSRLNRGVGAYKAPPGRWPANIVHDGSDEVVAAFPVSESTPPGNIKPSRATENVYGEYRSRSLVGHSDSGSAARFFASFPGDSKCITSNVSAAESNFSLSSDLAVSALGHAVAASTPALELIAESYRAPSMIATASEFALISEIATTATQSIGRKFLRGLPPERLTLTLNHAECVAEPGPTDTITITISRWRSNGSVDPVTFGIMPRSVDLGAPALGLGRRFHYSAKADADDRLGSKHPTVKPVDLMQWLVRLVTPPGGTVLDPFAGTGTTGEAAWREGFAAVLVEREAAYAEDIRRRMRLALGGQDERRRESIKAAKKTANAGPLFDRVEAAE